MPHVVFTSYAQHDRDQYLEDFIKEFHKELELAVVGHDPKELNFFDRDSVRAGDRWSEKIVTAVNEAHMLLCLMSPAYFTRPWCGRELQAFIERERGLPGAYNGGPFIVPIWWRRPPTPRPLPSRLGQFNYRDAGFPDAYDKEGVRALARQRKRLQVSRVIDTLIRLIEEARDKPDRLPAGGAIANIEDILNAFDEQQPYDVRLLALTTGGDAFKPTNGDLTVRAAVEQAAERLAIFIRPLETGPGLGQRLEKARDEQQLLLVVADAAAPLDPAIQEINALDLPNLAVLLIDTGVPAVGADAWVAPLGDGAFAKAKAAGAMLTAPAGQLDAQLQRLADDVRRKMIARAPAARAEAPDRVEAARQRGVPTELSNLSGPGGEAQK